VIAAAWNCRRAVMAFTGRRSTRTFRSVAW